LIYFWLKEQQHALDFSRNAIMKHLLVMIALSCLTFLVSAQTTYPLFGNDPIPNSIDVPDEENSETDQNGILRISKVTKPTLTAYLPAKENATGQAVIICPGGGYRILAASHEGSDVAEEFVKKGIAAFVLKYRLPNGETMIDKTIGPLQDAQQAILNGQGKC
jgi:acetyl esterase/lipase